MTANARSGPEPAEAQHSDGQAWLCLFSCVPTAPGPLSRSTYLHRANCCIFGFKESNNFIAALLSRTNCAKSDRALPEMLELVHGETSVGKLSVAVKIAARTSLLRGLTDSWQTRRSLNRFLLRDSEFVPTLVPSTDAPGNRCEGSTAVTSCHAD